MPRLLAAGGIFGCVHCVGGSVAPRAILDALHEKKISLSLSEVEPWISGRATLRIRYFGTRSLTCMFKQTDERDSYPQNTWIVTNLLPDLNAGVWESAFFVSRSRCNTYIMKELKYALYTCVCVCVCSFSYDAGMYLQQKIFSDTWHIKSRVLFSISPPPHIRMC